MEKEIITDYGERRQILAKMCADELGLKPVPEELLNLAIKKSELPLNIRSEEIAVAEKENSLLSMGIVYSYGSTLNFIGIDGHTYILPYNDIIKEELAKCGYFINTYGEANPFKYEKDKYGYVLPSFESQHNRIESEKEKEARSKYTLSKKLVDIICEDESLGNAPQIEAQEKGLDRENYEYDVFSHKLYRGHQYSFESQENICKFLGYDNEVARKFMAFTGTGLDLNRPYANVTNLQEYLEYIKNNEVLNDEIYFGKGGLYDQIMDYKKVEVTSYVNEGLANGSLVPIQAEKFARIIARQGVAGEQVTSWSVNAQGEEVQERVGFVSLDDETNEPGWIATKCDELGNPIVDENGHTNDWIIGDKTFKEKYELDSENPGLFKPAGGIQIFVQINENITLHQWGKDMNIAKGGYINITNPSDMYGISERDFNDTYKTIDEINKGKTK